MCRAWVRAAVFMGLFASMALADAEVTVVMLNSQEVHGKLIQYVGGELVVEETSGKRVAIDVRLVDQILFSRAGKRRKLKREGQFGPGLWRGAPSSRGKQVSGVAPSGDKRSKKPGNNREGPDGSGASLDSKFELLAGLAVEKQRDLDRARDAVADICLQARRNGQTDEVLKRFVKMAAEAKPGTRDKVKWLALTSFAHREAGEHDRARSFAFQAKQEAVRSQAGEDILRMIFPDKPGRRGPRRGRALPRP